MKEKQNHQNSTSQPANPSLLSSYDIHHFKEGTHYGLHEKLSAHPLTHEGVQGVLFAVWAPNEEKVSVIADFNHWDPAAQPMFIRWDGSGIWELFIPG